MTTQFKLKMLVFTLLASGFCNVAVAESVRKFRVATLLSKKVAPDYQCIVDGVLDGAKGDGFSISVDAFDYDNSLSKVITLAAEIANKKYDLVIGPRTSQEALATVQILDRSGIPQILPVASHADIPRISKTALRLVASSERYSELTAKFIGKTLNAKKVLVVSNLSQPYSTFYRDAFPGYLKKSGSKAEISYYGFIDGFRDYAAITKLAKEQAVDVIYAPIYSVEFTELYTGVSTAALSLNLVTHAGLFEARDILVKHYRPSIKTFFNGIWDLKKRGPDVAGFDKILSGACKNIPVSVRSAAAYDAAAMALRVLKANPQISSQQFVTAFKKLPYTGLLGEWRVDELGDPLRALNMFTLEKSGFKLFETL